MKLASSPGCLVYPSQSTPLTGSTKAARQSAVGNRRSSRCHSCPEALRVHQERPDVDQKDVAPCVTLNAYV